MEKVYRIYQGRYQETLLHQMEHIHFEEKSKTFLSVHLLLLPLLILEEASHSN